MSFVLHGKSYKSTTLIWSFVTIGLIVGIVYFISNVGAIRVPFLSDGEMSLRIARSVSVDGNIRLGMWASYFEGVSILRLLIGGGVGTAGNPHSVFVGAIMTFGLLGFIAVIMMMMQLVYTGGPKGLIVSVPMVAYLAISFASSSDVDRTQFWVLLGVSYVLVRAYKASESHQRISIPAGVMSPVRK